MSSLGKGIAAEPVRDEAVRPVGHRDDDVPSEAGARPLVERRQDLDDRREPAGGDVGGLHRRDARRRVPESPRPPEVVDVVARALRVAALGAEAGQRAVDDRVR